MKIYLASDHGGFELKRKIKAYLDGQPLFGQKMTVTDLGPETLNPQDDYPDYVLPLAERVAEDRDRLPGSRPPAGGQNAKLGTGVLGLVFCRSGAGAVIAANKVKGVRAVLSFSPEHAIKTRAEDNANVLALPADFIDFEKAKSIVKAFLQTPFSFAARHLRRLKKIEDYERGD